MNTVKIILPRKVKVGEKVRFKDNVPGVLKQYTGKEYTIKAIVQHLETEHWRRKWKFFHRICLIVPNGNEIVELEEISERTFSTDWFDLPLEQITLRVVRQKQCLRPEKIDYIELEPRQ